MISHLQAQSILNKYGQAWINQDTELLISLFSKDAVYAERQHKKPYQGRDEIAAYWDEKVVSEQSNITFTLHNVYVDKNTVIDEFSASAYSSVKKQTVELESVCVFDVNQELFITNWREFWHSKWK